MACSTLPGSVLVCSNIVNLSIDYSEALRSVKGCKDVTIPYLDESGQDFRENGLPSIFHEPNFELDGEVIDNPLYSYEIPLNITDHITKDPKDLYTKKRGYKTVRYPRSGLVGTHETRAITQTHNNQFTVEQAADHLNDNLMNWLGQSITIKGVKHVSIAMLSSLVNISNVKMLIPHF